MINVKDEVYNTLSVVSENVTDSYPSDWATFPAIQYTEEDNKVEEFTDGQECRSYVRYRVDIWHNKSTSKVALQVDKAIAKLGLVRTMCQDAPEPSQLKHKVMRYEGIIDNETRFVYHK